MASAGTALDLCVIRAEALLHAWAGQHQRQHYYKWQHHLKEEAETLFCKLFDAFTGVL
jgi:hypothetical protein